MDWARAKSIILILLLAFNVLLASEIYGYTQDKKIPAVTIQNTLKILDSRGVKLECRIPGYAGNIPKLEIDSTGPDRKLLAGKLLGDGYGDGKVFGTYVNGSKKVTFTDSDKIIYEDSAPSYTMDLKRPKTVEKYVRDFLADNGLADSSYILDQSAVKSDGSISMTYIQKYKGNLVFGNFVNVVATSKGIARLEAHSRHITGLSSDRTEDSADAYQVLLANFVQSGAVITGIDLGYDDAGLRDTTGVKPTEELPAWRVTVMDHGPRYFSAIDGKEIKN